MAGDTPIFSEEKPQGGDGAEIFTLEGKTPTELAKESLAKAQQLTSRMERSETLIFLGFVILLVMVATMVVAVLALFVSVLKDSGSSNNHSYYEQQQ